MEHIAIDLGSRESQVCIRDATGKIVHEQRVETRCLAKLLGARPRGRVIVETSAESLAIADAALAEGHEVRVVPATLVRALGVGARGIKNDVRDAQVLSEASCRLDLPSVHIPRHESRERKAICTSREGMVGVRTQLINMTRGYMRTQIATMKSGVSETFPKRVRACLMNQANGLPGHIEQVLKVIETLNEQIRLSDEELKELATRDETCLLLMTMPGVGPVTSTRFAAAIDDVKRFKDASHLESYLGLTPGENTTGFKQRRTRITKAGQPRLRHALGQAALVFRRLRPEDPMVRWAEQVAERRGKQKALVALARKMARTLWAMWRDGTRYDPSQGKPKTQRA